MSNKMPDDLLVHRRRLALPLDNAADDRLALLEELQLTEMYADEICIASGASLLTFWQEYFDGLRRKIRKHGDRLAVFHEIGVARDGIDQCAMKEQILYACVLL